MKKLICLIVILFVTVVSTVACINYTDITKNKEVWNEVHSSKKVLILLAHPSIEKSKANSALVDAVKELPNVRIINLYKEPFLKSTYIEAFRGADIVIFQFPFYWASAPHMLKKWCDEIFSSIQENPGVKGKRLMITTTTGSAHEAYRSGGKNHFTIDELLRPYQLLANRSGMIWMTPFVVYGVSLLDAAQRIEAGAKDYKEYILNLQTEN